MSTTYYYLHIPKTAGTSIIHWLAESGRFNTCPVGLWSDLLELPKSELEQYTLFCGHFYRHLSDYLNRPLNTFTFLRNPFDRAVSHYEHIRRDKNHFFYERLKEQGSLLAFLRDPLTQPLVKNFQVRSLSAIFDPEQLNTTIDKPAGQKYPLEKYITTTDTGLDDSKSLLLAKDFLSRCAFVGVTERLQKSVDGLAKVLGIPGGHQVESLNTNPSKAAVDPQSQEESSVLTDLLWADWELYEYGLRLYRDSGN